MENILEATPVAQVTKGKTIAIIVEKLDGGYISNPGGKRKIFKDADAVVDTLGLNDILHKMEHEEYHLDIRLTPKAEYIDFDSLVSLHNIAEEEKLTLEAARANGTVEKEVFDPCKNSGSMKEPDLNAPIKQVTAATAYSISRLKSINWADLHEKLHMEPSEIARRTGMNTTTLYASLPKARKGTLSFQNTSTRIGFTTLAQYYENTLGLRSSAKEQCELMKSNLFKIIREIELMTNGKQYIKSSEVSARLLSMRKELL